MLILWLCLIPIVLAVLARLILPATITRGEAAVKASIGCAILMVAYVFASLGNLSDVQILNGEITSKARNEVSCSHSYDCMCYTTCSSSSDGTQSCTEHCSTCYEHSYDVDWDVYSSVGDLSIAREDRRGLTEPPRWTEIKPGDPASDERRYINYLKAAPHSLFNTKLAEIEAKQNAALIPAYPRVYDYYKVQHAININAQVPNLEEWDKQIDLTLRDLGPSKQVNVLVVFVAGQGREYKHVLERAWVGAKKNDVVVVFGVTGTTVEWVEAFTFAKSDGNHMLAVQMRDQLQSLQSTTDPAPAVKIIRSVVIKHFTRVQMEKYKYLANESAPDAGTITWILILMLVVFTGMVWYFHTEDLNRF